MNLRIRCILSLNLFILANTLGFSLDDKGLGSNLEVSQPAEGTFGVVFAVTNNNLGNSFWVDPVSNGLNSYSLVGLGGKYYLTNTMRIGATTEAFYNLWTYANRDTQTLTGAALKAQFDYLFLRSGPISLSAGPVVELAFVLGSYTSSANAITTQVTGQTYSFGGIFGAEYFVHSQFSVGTSCPVLYRFVSTTTTGSTALVGPTQSSAYALGSIVLDLCYYW